VKIPVADGLVPAYRALPAQGGPLATVLVVQEIFGVHEHIKDICRRFAKAGYLAVAPELFARQGDMSKVTSRDEARALVQEERRGLSRQIGRADQKGPDARAPRGLP
jgi:carboxymethylenebutenolidase